MTCDSEKSVPTPATIAVVTCAVLEEEVRQFADDLRHVAAVEVLEQGLHNDPPKLRATIQQQVTRIETEHPQVEAVVLGYGLCSRGIEGVTSGRVRLIVPRAHDCITLLLGSRRRYGQYVAEHPGTYWYSPGWNRCHVPPGEQRYNERLAHYIEQYGEDNAKYLMETLEDWYTHYNRATYVDLGIGVTDADLQYSRDCADWLGWSFDRQHGDPELMRRMVTGPWPDEDFLTVTPGWTVRLTADDRVIEAVRSNGRADGTAGEDCDE